MTAMKEIAGKKKQIGKDGWDRKGKKIKRKS
jgi:hypothetical protein